MILFLLLQFPILFLHLILGCGGKKKTSGKIPRMSKNRRMIDESHRRPRSAIQSQSRDEAPKPEEVGPPAPPPKAPSPPKPVVQDTKVAEILPESIKEDEMKGGIQLPCPPKNMKCESDVALKEKPAEKKKEDDEIL